MNKSIHASRRGFLLGAPAGLGLAPAMQAAPAPAAAKANRLPREVWVATISQNNARADNHRQMIRLVLGRMEQVAPFEPDIVCLPEVFPFVNIEGRRPPLEEVAEEPVGETCRPFAEFARKHHCYVVCATYTKEKGRFYNSAVFLDRDGRALGAYRKSHPTIDELERGVHPGPLDPPVFQTDFGRVGAQICFDIQWRDGWEKLEAAGAEMVFWPSAFAGGSMVNTKAWEHKYVVVSSTRKGTTKICDVNGAEMARTNTFTHWVCAPVNLEKAMLHTWPYVQRFDEIRAKYGRRISITTYSEEEFTVIESRDPEVRVADVMREFELKTHVEHIAEAGREQKKRRG